jgi:hypothetical protein
VGRLDRGGQSDRKQEKALAQHPIPLLEYMKMVFGTTIYISTGGEGRRYTGWELGVFPEEQVIHSPL